MFPLDPATPLWLAFALGAGVVAVLFCLEGRWWTRALLFVALAVGSAVLVWQLTISDPPGDHEGLSALLLMVAALAVLVAAAVWAVIARWFVGLAADGRLARVTAAVVSVLPAAAGALAALEHQRVPAAPCADHARLALGDLTLTVPRAVGVTSFAAGSDAAPEWTGSYRSTPGSKSDVAAFCRQSDGGARALHVTGLVFGAEGLQALAAAHCDPAAAGCDALTAGRIHSIELRAGVDLVDRNVADLLEAPARPGLLTEGTANTGHACFGLDAAVSVSHCWLWRPTSAATVALVRTGQGLSRPPGPLLAETEAALSVVLAALSAGGGE